MPFTYLSRSICNETRLQMACGVVPTISFANEGNDALRSVLVPRSSTSSRSKSPISFGSDPLSPLPRTAHSLPELASSVSLIHMVIPTTCSTGAEVEAGVTRRQVSPNQGSVPLQGSRSDMSLWRYRSNASHPLLWCQEVLPPVLYATRRSGAGGEGKEHEGTG